jgi:23S rRNA pseudouridine1911/1915/1917 synthase
VADDLEILYDDGILLIVNKPSGLASQPDRSGGPNLFDLLRERYPYVGLHHRLDRPASGAVLFTLDKRANRAIAEAFRSHTISREYAAVLTGYAETTTWNRRLDSKRAVTHLECIGSGRGLSAARVTLETGRFHQIRRHAALAGVPLAGDRRYGGDDCRRWPRLALHALRLALVHPMTGAALHVEASIPNDLAPLWSDALG